MSTPAANGHFTVDIGALRNAETAVNGMALNSTTTGKTADEATNAAASAHQSWDTAGALRDALSEWHHQMDQLIGRLRQDSVAMEQTVSNYSSTDLSIADAMKQK
ncbi:hypothetical protein [Kitasatospora sp. NPDC093102]|uniref:hypothetical protein n=1 Tax=Kitasatospora sp. NPDC093102 TaxID=3155069 RepID=UPI003419DA18